MKHDRQSTSTIRRVITGLEQRGRKESGPGEMSPEYSLRRVVNRNGDDSELQDTIDRLIDDWLAENTDSIIAELVEHFTSTINKGIQNAYDSWNERLGTNFTRVLSLVARVLLAAVRLAKGLAVRFRPQIVEAVRQLVRKLRLEDKTEQQIINGVIDLLETAGLGKAIVDANKKVGEHEAFEMGRLLGNEALGATEKAWITAGDSRVDAICSHNAADGEIPIRDRFSSGHQTPPAHPGCRCTAIYFGVSRSSVYWAPTSIPR